MAVLSLNKEVDFDRSSPIWHFHSLSPGRYRPTSVRNVSIQNGVQGPPRFNISLRNDTRVSYSVVLPYRSIIHRLFSPSLSSWGQSEGREEARERRTIFFSLFPFFPSSFFPSPFERVSRTRSRVPTDANVSLFVARTTRQITDAKREFHAIVITKATKESWDWHESWEEVSQAGKEKDFREFGRGRGAKEERNFGNDSGRKSRTAARVRIRRQPLACETTDTTELAEDEARFAAGLKVPRCVTRLLGAELMPPSE